MHGGTARRRRAVRLEHVRPAHADARSSRTAHEHGIGFMAYGSLAFGLLTGTFTEDTTSAATTGGPARATWARSSCSTRCSAPRTFPDNVRAVEELKGIAARYDKSLPQLALRWAISHPAVSTALVGCRTVAEVEDNAGAIGWSISDADLAEIDAIFARHGVDTVSGLLDRRSCEHAGMSGELAGKVAIVTGGAGGHRPRDRRALRRGGRRGRHRRRRRRARRERWRPSSAPRRRSSRPTSPTRIRSRRSSTSRSSASVGCTSCATTPGSAVVAVASSTTTSTTSTR